MNLPENGSDMLETPEEFASRVNIQVDNKLLLRRALTHRSYLNEHPEAIEDNERLEFLGDAVLDFMVGDWLYNHFPEMAEGDLTRLRSALVRTEQLAEFARGLELGKALRLGHGEEEGGGRQRQSLLCGAFEALVGAVYLSAGLPAVLEFVEPQLLAVVQPILLDRRGQDPKSLFQEWAQAQGFGPPLYQTVSMNGPEHSRSFEVQVSVDGQVYGSGSGSSKQVAAKSAARAALESLGIG